MNNNNNHKNVGVCRRQGSLRLYTQFVSASAKKSVDFLCCARIASSFARFVPLLLCPGPFALGGEGRGGAGRGGEGRAGEGALGGLWAGLGTHYIHMLCGVCLLAVRRDKSDFEWRLTVEAFERAVVASTPMPEPA